MRVGLLSAAQALLAVAVGWWLGLPPGALLLLALLWDRKLIEAWNITQTVASRDATQRADVALTPMQLQVIAETARQVETSQDLTMFRFLASCQAISYEALRALMLVDVDAKLLKKQTEEGNQDFLRVRRDFLRNLAKKAGMLVPLKRLYKTAPGKRVHFGDKMRHWRFELAAIDKDWPAERYALRAKHNRASLRLEDGGTPGAPSVLADPVQLESALLNIALNARDAMPEGGVLRFHVDTCEDLPLALRAEQGTTPPGGYVAISIADTGTGMADSVKERAFEPFFTTKEAGRGTGLGLSTVYGFIHQSRGAITIDSSLGRGTTITIYLPAMRCAPAVTIEESATESLPPGLRVMLVEDDAEVRSVIQTFLQGLQCEVLTAATARQAMGILSMDQRPVDLLLSDIALGSGMRGTRLAAEAQQRFPGMAVLLMSGFPLNPSAAEDGEPLRWEVLRKPYSRSDLARAMSRALAGI